MMKAVQAGLLRAANPRGRSGDEHGLPRARPAWGLQPRMVQGAGPRAPHRGATTPHQHAEGTRRLRAPAGGDKAAVPSAPDAAWRTILRARSWKRRGAWHV